MIRKLIFILFPISIIAQELIYSFSLDTSVYRSQIAFGIRGPGNECNFPSMNPSSPSTDIIGCFNKKGTDQWDIYSFSGKTGSVVVPSSATPYGFSQSYLFFSQSFINADSNWECLATYSNGDLGYRFILFDHSGKQLLSDSGQAYYGFDGRNTYVYSCNILLFGAQNLFYKVWRFRTNVSANTFNTLAKTSSTSIGPMVTYSPPGNLHLYLQPAAGSTSIQIFDMLGRQLYKTNIQNIKSPTSFMIPQMEFPNSPIVTKVNNVDGSFYNKIIPVR